MKTKIAIAIDPELLARIDKMAEKFELSRSKLIENLLDTSLEDAEIMNSIGVLDVIRTLTKFKDKLKNSVGLKESVGKKVIPEPPLRKL